MFQKYPLALYLVGAYLAVANEAEQEAAEAEGYADWHTDQARMQQPAEQPELVATVATVDPEPAAPEPAAPAELDREALKAKAAELGLTYARTIKTEKLAELVAAVSKGA